MESLVANLAGKTRRVSEGGRDYIVAPLTLIVPGVLNGSKGPLFYPPEEVQRGAKLWNKIPLVVYHPHDPITNQPLSAQDPERGPEILARSGIGEVRQSKFNGKHVAEGWFDIAKTERVDKRVLANLMANRPIELSTGLFTDNEDVIGNYRGRRYTSIARNYRPDHLAILPDQTGACSIKDGCGVLINSRHQYLKEKLTMLTNANPEGCNQYKDCGESSSTVKSLDGEVGKSRSANDWKGVVDSLNGIASKGPQFNGMEFKDATASKLVRGPEEIKAFKKSVIDKLKEAGYKEVNRGKMQGGSETIQVYKRDGESNHSYKLHMAPRRSGGTRETRFKISVDQSWPSDQTNNSLQEKLQMLAQPTLAQKLQLLVNNNPEGINQYTKGIQKLDSSGSEEQLEFQIGKGDARYLGSKLGARTGSFISSLKSAGDNAAINRTANQYRIDAVMAQRIHATLSEKGLTARRPKYSNPTDNEQARDENGRFTSEGGGSAGSGKGSSKVHGAAKSGHKSSTPAGPAEPGDYTTGPTLPQTIKSGHSIPGSGKGSSKVHGAAKEGTKQINGETAKPQVSKAQSEYDKSIDEKAARLKSWGSADDYNKSGVYGPRKRTNNMASTLQDKLAAILNCDNIRNGGDKGESSGNKVVELKKGQKGFAPASTLADPGADVETTDVEDHDLINDGAESPEDEVTSDAKANKMPKAPEKCNACTLNAKVNQLTKGDQTMVVTLNAEERKAVVDGLIGNGCCFEEDERDFVNSLSDKTLARLTLTANAAAAVVSTKKDEGDGGSEDTEEDDRAGLGVRAGSGTGPNEAQANGNTPAGGAELEPKYPAKDGEKVGVTNLSAEDREVMEIGRQFIRNRKAQLIQTITTNKQNPFGKSELEVMGVPQLEKLARLAAVVPAQEPNFSLNRASYFGAAVPATMTDSQMMVDNQDDEYSAPLSLPTLNYSKKDGRTVIE